MISWMVDFASRLVEKHPNSSDPLSEPAVLLLDEIDLHLHPKWQRDIMGFLSKNFPGTQFIVTAHSPLIAQSAVDANIAVLRSEGDHVVIDNAPDVVRNWRIDQVLTSDLFGVKTARPPQLDALLQKRQEIMTKGTLSATDKVELRRVDDEIGELPVGDTVDDARKISRLLGESRGLLKKYKRGK
jgi:predicted ATP-binding protein involved in virulence